MIGRAAAAAIVATLALAAPASGFDACQRTGTTVAVTFGTETAGTLKQVGTAIHTEDGACGDATTANTATIEVFGDADHEVLSIDLSGGTFAGGVVDESGTSDEVEIEVDFGEESDPPDDAYAYFPLGPPEVIVLGTGGADHVTAGISGPILPRSDRFTEINLNADEGSTVDPDVIFSDRRFAEVRGLGGADVLSAAGGTGGGFLSGDPQVTLRGGPGGDDLSAGYTLPGPGDDTVRNQGFFNATASYFDAPNAVTVVLKDGAGGDWGGTAPGGDGEATPGTDTYVGGVRVVGSDAHGDTFTAAPQGSAIHGAGGADLFNGGPELDELNGGAGGDTIHGAGGDDWLFGGSGDDFLYGEADDDELDGEDGDDVEDGGPGDDLFDEYGTGFGSTPDPDPNGADDFLGGAGYDVVVYGNNNEFDADPFAVGVGRTAGVSVDLDDAADDGAPGEGDNAHADLEAIGGGRGADTLTGDADDNVILSWNGDDVVNVRGGGTDVVYCGAGGDDLVRADASDTYGDGSCERIELTDPAPDPPSPPPGDSPPPPPAEPPPLITPPVVVPPVVTPPAAAPPVSRLLALPSSRRCASRRKFTVRVRREIRGTVKAVTIFVNGKRVKRVTGSRIGLPIDLRGLPKGKIRVRLRVELNDGRVATDTRTYRTCATKKRKGRFSR
ncbi:MAG TPA: hypothetical protein VF529_06900 [Solirubrobacteraceae bacterium]